jgi:hypothetical protein
MLNAGVLKKQIIIPLEIMISDVHESSQLNGIDNNIL